jgi:hypothetical protein
MSWPEAGLNLKATAAAEIFGRDTGTHPTAAQCLRRVVNKSCAHLESGECNQPPINPGSMSIVGA